MKLVKARYPVHHNVYGRAITFLYGSREQINKSLRYELGNDEHKLANNCQGKWIIVHHEGWEADYIVVVRRFIRAQEMAVLVHEALHHAAHTLRTAGIEFTRKTEEAYCYYQQWVVEQCLRDMR